MRDPDMGKTRRKTSLPLGPRIEKFRKEMGLSRADLARQTGLSTETITRVEQQKEMPPVGAILQISRALCLDAGEFLTQAEKESRKKSKKESFDKRSRSYGYKTLSPGAAAMHLKAFEITIEPHRDHDMVEYRHEGEEFLYVLKGDLDITVGENQYHLTTGKSLHFNSATPHMLKNPGAVKTKLIVVLYTP